jgi:ABC-2 type transport system permease protein
MRAGKLKAIVQARAGFGDNLAVRLRVVVDPSDRSSAAAIAALVDSATRPSGTNQPSKAPEVVPLQGQRFSPATYFVPTLLAMALMQLGIYGAVTIVQQRERQILKRFASAPIQRWSIVGSIVNARLVVAVIQTVLMLIAGRLLTGTAFSGNPLVIAGLVLLCSATFIAIGFALSGLARSEDSATQLAGFVSLPLMFLSGLFIPLDQLPALIKPLAVLLPVTYAADALRQVLVNGTPVFPMALAVGALLAWLLGSLAVAVRFFRWQ